MRFLSDRDVAGLVTVTEAADAVEKAFRSLAAGTAVVQPRVRTPSRIGKLSMLGAVLEEPSVAGAKVYTTAPEGTFRFATLLFDPAEGCWLAAVEAGELTRLRTAATSLMVARKLADLTAPAVLTVFGAGVQARSHVVAFCQALAIGEVRLVHRRPVPELVDQLREKTGAAVVQVEHPGKAVSDADLVVTATRSETPLFAGDTLPVGAHVTSVGATLPTSRELDRTTVERAARVVVEDRQQARYESGNLIAAAIDWDLVEDLADVVTGLRPSPRGGDITLFDSLGTGLADVAVAALCHRRAVEKDVGSELETEGGPP